jgi:hypothetical protein
MHITADQVIRHFGLIPLRGEGGMFRQSYVASEWIPRPALPPRYGNDKPLSTAIYYLLTGDPDTFSALHRLPTDEVYHFYAGDPVDLLLLHPGGQGEQVCLGADFLDGAQVQLVVPRGTWQGSRLVPGGSWALLGATMAPGYTDADYEGGNRAELLARYPAFSAEILSLTRE